MIKSYGMDVECFPNLFSITFIDLQNYLETFKDCVDDKGKPRALTECLTVKEIKNRLDNVESKIFYISDTDDSQLLDMVSFINDMQAYYETITDENGNVKQIPHRTDLFGFNNQGYDDLMIKTFLMMFNRFDTTKDLIKYLKEINDKIIKLQKDKDTFYSDKQIELIRNYRLPYATVDLQKVYGLHAATVNINKESGERVKFGKSLKQTSINLKWHELLDFVLPPINEEEYEIYWSKKDNYRGLNIDELNKLITNDFDRYILPKYIEPMLYYNKNDVFICCEMIRQKPDEVKLRYSLTSAFKINCLCSARSNISDKLLVKFYSDFSGLHKSKFEKLRTERTRLSFNKVIFPHIKFQTPKLQELLKEMKEIVIYHTNKDSFMREIDLYGTKYTLATGGIHSQDKPGILKSNEEYTYIHFDIASFYPSIMISYNVAPKHLNEQVFIKLITYLRDTRVKCKHQKDEDGLIITGVPNKLSAEALKIVINAIYGKLGSDSMWLYDRLAQLKVTINGQLMIMMLVESLELNDIHVISANTDGIIVKLPNNKKEKFKEVTDIWLKENKLEADSENYKLFVTRDINNYINIQDNGTIEFKGALDPKQYLKDLKKGYDMPIVAKAVFEYFVNNVPVMTTLQNHKDILDFCKTQNVGNQFDVVYHKVINNKIETIYSQRHVRFYVSTKGICIQKKHKITNTQSKLAGGKPVIILNSLDDKPIEERDINYAYYYNECYKIIDPIMLQISPNQKGNRDKKTLSGKNLIKKYSQQYNSLFDDNDLENN